MNQSGLCVFRVAWDQMEALSKVSMKLEQTCCPPGCSLNPLHKSMKGQELGDLDPGPTSALAVRKLGGSHLNALSVRFL